MKKRDEQKGWSGGDKGAFLSRVAVDGVDRAGASGGGSRDAHERSRREKMHTALRQRYSDGNERTRAYPSNNVDSFGKFNDPNESFAKRFTSFSRALYHARTF